MDAGDPEMAYVHPDPLFPRLKEEETLRHWAKKSRAEEEGGPQSSAWSQRLGKFGREAISGECETTLGFTN